MKIDQKGSIVFWGYEWVSSGSITQQLGQHQFIIDSLLSKARILKNENIQNMKRLWEAKKFSLRGHWHHLQAK
jgi:hypothetical protein